MKIIDSVVAALKYQKASKLYNDGRYQEALAKLDEVKANAETQAKIVLFSADIRHKMRDLKEAETLYVRFQEKEISSISREEDRSYLRAYCDYYLVQLRRKMGRDDVGTTVEDVRHAAKHASLLVRGEFVPP